MLVLVSSILAKTSENSEKDTKNALFTPYKGGVIILKDMNGVE
jgi:hypothetical protein